MRQRGEIQGRFINHLNTGTKISKNRRERKEKRKKGSKKQEGNSGIEEMEKKSRAFRPAHA